jgi:hypothetical protein
VYFTLPSRALGYWRTVPYGSTTKSANTFELSLIVPAFGRSVVLVPGVAQLTGLANHDIDMEDTLLAEYDRRPTNVCPYGLCFVPINCSSFQLSNLDHNANDKEPYSYEPWTAVTGSSRVTRTLHCGHEAVLHSRVVLKVS